MSTTHHQTQEAAQDVSHPIPSGAVAALFVLAATVAVASSILIRHVDLGWTAGILVALAPVPVLLMLAIAWHRMLAALDEFERMLRMQAGLVALTAVALIMFVVGQLRLVGIGGAEDWNMVWPAALLVYLLTYRAKMSAYRR
jgi:hypothetical protein